MCHLKTGIFQKYVTLKIKKQPIYSDVFDLIRHFMSNYAFSCIKIFYVHKNGDCYLLNHINLTILTAPVAPKMYHFFPFSPSRFFHFRLFRWRKMCLLRSKLAPFWGVPFPRFDPCLKCYLFVSHVSDLLSKHQYFKVTSECI